MNRKLNIVTISNNQFNFVQIMEFLIKKKKKISIRNRSGMLADGIHLSKKKKNCNTSGDSMRIFMVFYLNKWFKLLRDTIHALCFASFIRAADRMYA